LEFSTLNIVEFVLIGTSVGFLGGFLGVGGGAIMIPALTYWVFPSMGVSTDVVMHLAFGTSLAIIIPTSLSGAWAHAREGNVNWRIVYLLALSGIPGSFFGSTLSAYLPGSVLRTLFGILLIMVSLQMFLQKKRSEDSGNQGFRQAFPALAVGMVVGVFSGFFGIGGGIVAIPLMVRILKLPIHNAVGISIAFVFFASVAGTAGYIFNGWGQPNLPPLSLGYVHVPGWVLAGIPSILLSRWGVRLAIKTRPLRLHRIFALMLMLVGIRMVF
jgi:hypothetical protein